MAETHTHDHDTDEERKLTPTAEVQDVGPCKVKVKVAVSAEKVKEEIEHKYQELNDSMTLPGFRKGKAPRNVLERKFGKALLDDLKFELLNRSFEEVKEDKALDPVGEPDVPEVEKLAVEDGKPFAYEVSFEVRPKIEVKSYDGLKVKKPKAAVDDKQIETVLRGFQDQKAELLPVEDGTAKKGDQAILDFELVVDGKAVDTAENNAIFLTEDLQFYGVELKDYYQALEGKKVGDSVDYTIKLPESYADKAHVGKDATIRAKLKSVKRKKLPEVDAEFAKKHFDMDSVDELREHVKKRILREMEEAGKAQMGEALVEQLVAQNDFPMPEGMIETGAEQAMQRLHVDLAMKGVAEEEIAKTLEKEKAGSKEKMAKALKAHFLLEHIAQKEKIYVTEEQVEERVGQIASQYGRWPHEMKAYLEQQGLLSQIRRSMREELVKEFLLTKAVIEEDK